MKKLYEKYCKLEEIICGSAFLSIVILTLVAMLMRNMNKMWPDTVKPIVWADDLARLMFAWASFLGADVAFRHSRLVGMNILTTKMAPKVQKVLLLVTHTLILGILIIFANSGYKLAIQNWARTFQTISTLSYSWVTLSLVVGSILMSMTAIIRMCKVIINFKNDEYDLHRDTPDKRESTDELTEEEIELMKANLAGSSKEA